MLCDVFRTVEDINRFLFIPDCYKKKDSSNPFAQVKDRNDWQKIIKTLKVTEGYLMFRNNAMKSYMRYQDDIPVSSYTVPWIFSN